MLQIEIRNWWPWKDWYVHQSSQMGLGILPNIHHERLQQRHVFSRLTRKRIWQIVAVSNWMDVSLYSSFAVRTGSCHPCHCYRRRTIWCEFSRPPDFGKNRITCVITTNNVHVYTTLIYKLTNQYLHKYDLRNIKYIFRLNLNLNKLNMLVHSFLRFEHKTKHNQCRIW